MRNLLSQQPAAAGSKVREGAIASSIFCCSQKYSGSQLIAIILSVHVQFMILSGILHYPI